MGYHARVSVESVGLPKSGAAPAMQDAPVRTVAAGKPVSGWVVRNGKPIPFTLETSVMAPEAHHLLPEQFIMAGLLLISFCVPIFHLLG